MVSDVVAIGVSGDYREQNRCVHLKLRGYDYVMVIGACRGLLQRLLISIPIMVSDVNVMTF